MSYSSLIIAIGFFACGSESFSPPLVSPSLPSYASQTTQQRRTIFNNQCKSYLILHETVTETDEGTTTDTDAGSPSSVVFYDDFLDPDNPTGVVCARGVCVLPDDEEIDWSKPPSAEALEQQREQSIVDKFLNSYLGPRMLLAFASILYGTNFPLGAIMNDSLPPSAATSARMLMASLALSPFLFKLEGKLAPKALLCGCFTALGYITQSLSLVDTSPAKVAFLGEIINNER